SGPFFATSPNDGWPSTQPPRTTTSRTNIASGFTPLRWSLSRADFAGADELPARHGVERASRLQCLSSLEDAREDWCTFRDCNRKEQDRERRISSGPRHLASARTGFEPAAFGSRGDRTSAFARHKLSCVALRQVRVLSTEALVGQREPV